MVTYKDSHITLIYSKNHCPKCMMTKNVLTSKGIPFKEVNIEESDEFEKYVEFIKSEYNAASLPVVHPIRESGLLPWNDFQIELIDQLCRYYEEQKSYS